MDYMDAHDRRKHGIMVALGYVLIGTALLLVTTILMYVAYGFGYKNGQVIQSGLVFVSSKPHPAELYVGGVRNKNNTNTRLSLPAGSYDIGLHRDGYRDWGRTIKVIGGKVEHFDYPFLFPSTLKTTTVHNYPAMPPLVTQSPNHRWLLAEEPTAPTTFDIYDLKSPAQPPTTITLPTSLVTASTDKVSFSLVEWSNDNQHFLLQRTYGTNTEYLLVNMTDVTTSVNLTRTLTLPTTNLTVQLNNKQADHFYIYDAAAQALAQATLTSSAPTVYLEHVLAYKTYGTNTVLYATPDQAAKDQVDVDLFDGNDTHIIRQLPAGSTYLLDLTKYAGDLYVVAGAHSDDSVYVYKNPTDQLDDRDIGAALPLKVLRVAKPDFVKFSDSAQFIVAEGGRTFAVYDNENKAAYAYTLNEPLDAPQTHATWMDGARLMYVTKGQVLVFDYDGTNRQLLESASPQYVPYFDSSFKFLYTLTHPATDRTHELLTSTSMLAPADQ